MKTKITLLMAVVALLTLSYWQPATAQSWNLTLNSTVTSTSGLGTTSTNTNPLRFVTHGSERMRIDANGNFGIGTTSLGSAKFIVNGSSSPFRAQVNGSTKFIVNSNGGVSVGSSTTPPSNGLYVAGNVGIGTPTPASRLEVSGNDGNPVLAKFTNAITTSTGNHEALVEMQATTADHDIAKWRFGVDGAWGTYDLGNEGRFYIAHVGASSPEVSIGNGVYIDNGLSVKNGGIDAESDYNTALTAATSGDWPAVGVDASSVNYFGVRAYSSNEIGLYAETGNPGSSYAGWFQGDVNVTGTLFQGSDRKLKQNISDFTSAMSVINKLQPKEYEYRQDGNFKQMNLPHGKHYGLIAQDVEQILPNLVKEAKFNTEKKILAGKTTSARAQSGSAKGEVIDYKALNYTELIPIMIKAMQELSAENKDLRKQIDELKGVKTAGNQNAVTQQAATRLMLTSASLDQNNPNPFAGATTIHYSLPVGFKTAHIIITDNSGRTIKQVQLNTAGSGTVNIDASTLIDGTYNYSLVVDGRVIENKKMIVAH